MRYAVWLLSRISIETCFPFFILLSYNNIARLYYQFRQIKDVCNTGSFTERQRSERVKQVESDTVMGDAKLVAVHASETNDPAHSRPLAIGNLCLSTARAAESTGCICAAQPPHHLRTPVSYDCSRLMNKSDRDLFL